MSRSDNLAILSRIPAMLHVFRTKGMARDVVTTTVWNVVGRSVGFFIPIFTAAWFGITQETDAFFIVLGLVQFLANVFAVSMEAVIVPFIAEARARESNPSHLVGSVITFTGPLLIIVLLAAWTLGQPFLAVVTRLSPSEVELGASLLLEISPLVAVVIVSSTLSGTLNAYKVFWLPALSPAVRGISVIAIAYALRFKYGIHALALGYLVGELLKAGISYYGLLKFTDCRPRLTASLEREVIGFFKVAGYQVLGMAAVGLNPTVDRVMASWAGPGGPSIIEYADKLYFVPATFLSVGILPVILSYWSDSHYQESNLPLYPRVMKMGYCVGLLALIISAPLLLGSHRIISTVYGHGELEIKYLPILSMTFLLYILGLAPSQMGLVFTRAHLATKDTATLMRLGVLNMILNIGFNWVFLKLIGLPGIALSTTVVSSLVSVGLWASFRRKELLRGDLAN